MLRIDGAESAAPSRETAATHAQPEYHLTQRLPRPRESQCAGTAGVERRQHCDARNQCRDQGCCRDEERGRSAQTFVVDVIVRSGDTERRVAATGQDIYAISAQAAESGADMDQLAAQIRVERHVKAIDELKPRLVWLSASHPLDAEAFLRQIAEPPSAEKRRVIQQSIDRGRKLVEVMLAARDTSAPSAATDKASPPCCEADAPSASDRRSIQG